MTVSPILFAKSESEIQLLPEMANRHGIIVGATGSGKTATVRVLAEAFSERGVPVFLPDVKGDLSGMAAPGVLNDKIKDRIAKLSLEEYVPAAQSVIFWDIFGEKGHPLRSTISEMGPLLLSRLLNLNEVQSGVLHVVFKAADEEGLLLLDIKDLQSVLTFISENSSTISKQYGMVSPASIAAIQRALLMFEGQGVENFFGEPALQVLDLLQGDPQGRGYINILSADRLFSSPTAYTTALLWLLVELYETLPEVGDVEKPKLVFFFDEAHLLFRDAPRVLIEKVEQIIRLVRSKGVSVFFISQAISDIPDSILAQLSNRIVHALRAFTPKEQTGLKAVADNLASDGTFAVREAIAALSIGEAVISVLDAKGTPLPAKRGLIVPPRSSFDSISDAERQRLMRSSIMNSIYNTPLDRESAFEILKARNEQTQNSSKTATPSSESAPGVLTTLFKSQGKRQSPLEAMVTSAARSVGTSVARQIMRGIMGSILGGTSQSRGYR